MDKDNSPKKRDNSTSPDHWFDEPEKRLDNQSRTKFGRDDPEETKTNHNRSNFDDYWTELDTQFPGDPTGPWAPNTTLFIHTDWNQIEVYKLYR